MDSGYSCCMKGLLGVNRGEHFCEDETCSWLALLIICLYGRATTFTVLSISYAWL